MSVTIDPTLPPNTESPRLGALRIRNLAVALLGLLNQSTVTPVTLGGPFITSIDGSGNATFPIGTLVAGDPVTALGLATKQYADAKVPYAVATGGDNYVVTFADIPSLTNGQYIQVKFPVANSGVSPTLNLNATGAVQIKTVTGGSPAAGTIATGGTYLLVYDSGTNTWVLSGIANAGTPTFPLQADVSANNHKITTLANATATGDALNLGQFTGTNATSGNIKLPALVGGILVTFVIQWGVVAPASIPNTGQTATAVSFSTAFASACYAVAPSLTGDSGVGGQSSMELQVSNGSVSTTGFTFLFINNTGGNRNMGAYYIAIGV